MRSRELSDSLQRAMDVVLSVAAAVVLAPVMLVLAWRVRREFGSPVLFAQQRPGRDGRAFTLRKFRTMTDALDPDGAPLPDEVRLTPFGRWLRSTSLDELPELFNVMRGEMSLVGPRPLLSEYLELYSPAQARRHEVRPGITGWAQVNGRNDLPWEDKLALDTWYVDHRSIGLNLRILLRSGAVMLRRDGVTLAGHATTVPFRGQRAAAPDRREPRDELTVERAAAPDRREPPDELTVRRAVDADLPSILELLQSSLGWVPDEQYAAFYRWKHHDNPFGVSPAWVALDGDRLVGLRVWLRWRFVASGRRWDAVRAVDTATHPAYQGRGIFRRLTTSSLAVLGDEGVAHVFNTPNEQSLPGYLKMGWEPVGKLPIGVRFRSPVAAATALRARVPADKWSLPSDAGLPAADLLRDGAEVAALIAALPGTRIRTDLDVDVLRWRYGFGPLHYRAVRVPGGIGMFRLRRRGPATECVVGHLLAPDDATAGRLLRRIAKVSGADQVLQVTDRPHLRGGFLPLPGGGPVFTWRALAETRMPELRRWNLTMGDVELF